MQIDINDYPITIKVNVVSVRKKNENPDILCTLFMQGTRVTETHGNALSVLEARTHIFLRTSRGVYEQWLTSIEPVHEISNNVAF